MSRATRWTSAKLEEVAKTATGGTPVRSNRTYFAGTIPWVKSGELDDNTIYDTEEHLSSDALRESSVKLFPKGTVLVALYGATVGKTAVLETDAATNQAVCAIFVDDRFLDHQFLRYFLMHIRPALLGQRYGGAQPNISQAIIRNTQVHFPSIREQRQIAAVLSAAQRAIERQERLIGLTAELKRALMHKLFTEGTRGEPLKQQTRFGSLPASWSVVPLGECCQVQTGIAKGRKVNADDVMAVPYLRVANVQDGHLDLQKVKTITIRRGELSRYSLRPGDVVLTEGGDLDKLGRGFIWNGQVADCVHQNHIFVARPNRSRLSSEFIAYQTQSPYGKQYFLSVAHKTTNLACINTSKLKAFPVLIPAQEEQAEIVRILQLVDQRRSVASRTLTSLESLFRALLHQLMTAQIRVHDLDLSALEEAVQEPVGAV